MRQNISLWVEKYRPSNVNHIVQQDEIKNLLNNIIINKTLTHMLFFGPPGTGKTSVALAFAKHLFYTSQKENEDVWNYKKRNELILNERVMELNASDERGIKVVRDKIKNFAATSIKCNENLPPFKIIILDEADAMTSDSQYALRRIIEKYTYNTRFILICNYVTRIIYPLASRCSKYRFQNISEDAIKTIINRIIEKEKIQLTDEAINILYKITKGDLRKIINLLQKISSMYTIINKENILKVIGYIPDNIVSNIWNNLISDNINYGQLLLLTKQFYNQSYSINYLINNILEIVINAEISDSKKSDIILIISEVDYNISDNSSELIQLYKLFTNIKYIIAS